MDLLASSVVGYLWPALQNRTVGAAAEQLLNLVPIDFETTLQSRRILTNEPERLNSDLGPFVGSNSPSRRRSSTMRRTA